MFDVTNFLMRWLFLCNLIRDVAEIQTLPYNPNAPIQHVEQAISHPITCEEEWRDNCLRGILSYPPGTQRLLVMDSMRAELVSRLSEALCTADQTLIEYECSRRRANGQIQQGNSQYPGKDDLYLDADAEILNAFKEETFDSPTTPGKTDAARIEYIDEEEHENKAVMIVSNKTVNTGEALGATRCMTHSKVEITEVDLRPPPSINEVTDAQQTIRAVRDYLPQLVSAVLKSPPAFETRLLDPIEKLRQLIIKRCVEDANWGVDMCWLLEAEVGRAWKTLFEHRQQTGRRLIIVLPAEKAAVLAKIGTEKREAFDLLQDSEQATAYGYTMPMDTSLHHNYHYESHPSYDTTDESARLPSSLSLRRCSHFGDTMHFIDRLTKVSLELRQLPYVHRHAYLQDSLREMNRRLRRRMVTRGDVSLDVEDNRGPDDWPLLSDVSMDHLRHSVHLPLDPKQESKWPGGDVSTDDLAGGAVRILNIVVEECRTLASRERCPFLVHVEVAETDLNGNDSRLYASGAPGLGATVEEALSMSAAATSMTSAIQGHGLQQCHTPYQIPRELLVPGVKEDHTRNVVVDSSEEKENIAYSESSESLRGGWQSNETIFYPSHPDPDDVLTSNPYEDIRQNQYEQLHQQMYSEHEVMEAPFQAPVQRHPIVSTREALLDRVFGQPWAEKCEEIRQASPYGNAEGWRLASFIIKAGEDIRREALVMQIISKLNDWFQTDIPEAIRPHLRPYSIMCVGGDAGLVECLSDAKSIDEVKKRTDNFESLRDYFERAYGPPTTYTDQYRSSQGDNTHRILTFGEAQENFLRSLVGYSLVCYILQIKDRHNANILLDREGNIVHIDFGFVLGDTPKMGKVPIFSERAPFKLSTEFWDVLGGWNVNQGGLGVRFCNMFENAFASAATHSEEIVSLVEATMLTLTQSPRQARILANGVRSRLRMRGPPGSKEQKAFVMELVNAALTSWGTSTYDWLQKNMNGYQ